MQTFLYKDMRVRYFYMLVLASLEFIGYALGLIGTLDKLCTYALPVAIFAVGLNVTVMSAALTLIVIAVLGLTRKVKLDETSVVLNYKKIRLDEIKSIGMDEKDEKKLSITVEYGFLHTSTARMGMRESDGDIEQFRLAMKELISRTKQSNPSADIKTEAEMLVTPGSKICSMAAENIRNEKATLTGFSGWLLYIALGLLILGFDGALGPIVTFAKLSLSPVSGTAFWGNMINEFLWATYIPISIVLLISFFKARPIFKKQYLAFLVYQIVIDKIMFVLQSSLINGIWPSTLSIINTFAVGTFTGVVWFFAWKEYFKRSIRVKNTFRDAPDVTAKSDI